VKDPVIKGLYAVTDEHLTPDRLLDKTAQAIRGGATIVQYRNKSSDRQQHIHEARALLSLCRQLHVPLIVNDDVMLAKSEGADGVHLGKHDESIRQARAELGKQAIIGVSCYNDLQCAITAQEMGADYVAFGSFFPSPTKPDAVTAPLELLQQAKNTLDIPVVAIGGITPHNAPTLIDAGADAVAVIRGLFGHANTGFMAREYARLFDRRQYRVASK
jgi:thiamine-phosphate pyrophosphorylase